MKIHELKILKCYADFVASGEKTFEYRFNDRNYQVGDLIKFKVIDDESKYFISHSLSEKEYIITYMLKVPFSNWVILAIKEVKK